jgi:hypothetical protein
MKFFSLLAALLLLLISTMSMAEAKCRNINVFEVDNEINSWKGREVVAFASWCSTCKEKILATRANPEKYILVSTFDDVRHSENVIRKLCLKSDCVFGAELASRLEIKALSWSKVF